LEKISIGPLSTKVANIRFYRTHSRRQSIRMQSV